MTPRARLTRFEAAPIWPLVVIAVVLLGYLICGKSPAVEEWITRGQQTLKIEFYSLLPEPTPQPAGTSTVRSPPGYVTVTDASFSALTTSMKEGP
jgi:hypothetical protein